jgi:hypothetical protein
LNYAGIRSDLLPVVFDAALSKQNKYLPGVHIPISAPHLLAEIRPHTVLILPWNIAEEVIEQNKNVRDWGGQFAVAVPYMRIIK